LSGYPSNSLKTSQSIIVFTLSIPAKWEQQQKALSILQLKLDILWAMLDAMQIAYHYNEPPYHCVKGGAVRPRAYSSVFGS
jgi:hypothetical protein